ncbi:MAG: hypothetical protein GC206_14420 [Alphaproteobacteria bacterium]|nr:hypothetical protein [Alphaproteobacteria bacterium]
MTGAVLSDITRGTFAMRAHNHADYLLSHDAEHGPDAAPPSPMKVALFGAAVFAAVFFAAMGGTAFMITGGLGAGDETSGAPLVESQAFVAPASDDTSAPESERIERVAAAPVANAPTSAVFVPVRRTARDFEETTRAEPSREDGDAFGASAPILDGAPPPTLLPTFGVDDRAF